MGENKTSNIHIKYRCGGALQYIVNNASLGSGHTMYNNRLDKSEVLIKNDSCFQ